MPPQLKMRFNKFNTLPEVRLPEGYALRRFRPGDEDLWMEALNVTGELGTWDRQKITGQLKGDPPQVLMEGIFFITFKDQIAATACVVPAGTTDDRPGLGWVSVSPGHGGKGLGYQVSLAALHFLKDKRHPEVFLLTDDHRIPALKTYLKMCFEPEMTHEGHPARWKAVFKKLSWRGAVQA